MSTFCLCLGCQRHVRSAERRCPFCGSEQLARSAGVSLDSGAARSRRYAAGVALLAGGATFACGDGTTTSLGMTSTASGGQVTSGGQAATGTTTTSSGGASTSMGGSTQNQASGGNTTSGGGGSQTTTQGGAAAMAGAANTGGSSMPDGMAGASNGTAVQPTGRACGDAQDVAGCRLASDCPGATDPQMPTTGALPIGQAIVYCATTPIAQAQGCGNPTFLPMCGECSDGFVCRPMGSCGASECVPVCDPATCNGENECVGDDCVAKSCDAEGAAPCAEGYECRPQMGGTTSSCQALRCDADEIDCAPIEVCNGPGADAHGCGLRTCEVDEDCGDCGYCVGTYCRETLGTCYTQVQQPAMPYGCVWPDEELV